MSVSSATKNPAKAISSTAGERPAYVKPHDEDADALETCIGQAQRLMGEWAIQERGCMGTASSAITEAQSKLEAIIDDLITATHRERIAAAAGRI